MGAVDWSKGVSTKKLRYINMQENLIRKNGPLGTNFVSTGHIAGKCNPADNFMKEQKCNATFVESRDTYMCSLADGGCWTRSSPIPISV